MRTRLLASGAALGVAAATLVATGLPVQAAEGAPGLGSGRALVRLDIPRATIAKEGKGRYRLVLPPGTTGQWMGERKDSAGRQRSLVGDITAKKLTNRWSNLRYTKDDLGAFLQWNTSSSTDNRVARVQLGKPRITSEGVVFTFASEDSIPLKISDVTLHLPKAPEKQRGGRAVTPGYDDRNVSGDLWISYTPNDGSVTTGIYNVSNGNFCFGKHTYGVQTDNNVYYQSVGSNTCATVYYEDYYLKSAGAQHPHGVEVTSQGLQYQLTVTPPPDPTTGADSDSFYYYYLW